MKYWLLSAIIALASMLMTCARDYNPFADSGNAKAVVQTSSITANDTVPVFGLDTLRLAVAGAEKVDSVRISFGANRLCADSVVIPDGAANVTYDFFISYYDTGRQEIEIITYRIGGERVNRRIPLYVGMPLIQTPVTGAYDRPIHLLTPGVVSSDVLYVWDFGRGGTFSSPLPETTITVIHASPSDTGYLWVRELRGNRSSPKVRFPFNLDDDLGPAIVCVNEGFVNKNTIFAGSPTFPLRFSITDRGLGSVYEALIDSTSFDIVKDGIYVKILHSLDTLTGYRPIVVSAIDNAYYKNATIDTFYLGYDPSLEQTGEGIQIAVLVPPRDSLAFNTRARPLRGLLRNYTGNTINTVIRFAVNGVADTDTVSIRGDGVRHEWAATVQLADNASTITISAHDSLDRVVADTSLTLFYDPNFVDTTKPVIVEVTSDGRAADYLHTPDTRIPIRVLAFDEGGGIQSVTLNGAAMSSGDGDQGYVWVDTIDLVHNANKLAIVVTDKNGASTTSDVTIYQNNVPQVQRAPSPPFPLFVNATYRDTIHFFDADVGDDVTVTKRAGPDLLTVDGLGNIVWTPKQTDVGEHTVELLYTDGVISQQLQYTYTIEVKDTVDFSLPAFTTTEQAFPAYVELGAETLSVALSLATNYGTPPYTITASAPSSSSPPRVEGDSVVTWVPAPGDTGYQRLYVVVNDKYGSADTLVPTILVVPTNRPPELLVTYTVDTLPGGIIDLTRSADPETLVFTVVDPDHPLSEKHTVRVVYPDAEIVTGLDSTRTFKVVLDPHGRTAGTDTVEVHVTDRGENTSSKTLILLY